MRVGIVAILHESNTFLKTPTTLDQFQHDLLLRGNEGRRLESAHHEVGGFFEGLKANQIDAVPIIVARAIPSGTITADCHEALLATLETEIERAGRIDGLLVAPHGATVSEAAPDFDGNWLSILRRRFQRPFPIIGTLDPHGNLSDLMIQSTDALVAYRTNPHLDQRERGFDAASLMARTLRGEIRPTQAAAFPPMIINIERQLTSEPQCAEQYRFGNDVQSKPGVLAQSLMLGFPYADVAEMGSAVIVVTNNDQAQAKELANRWGDFLWSRRCDFVGQFVEVADVMNIVAMESGPICLLDMGDNVGGGSPGDGTVLAHELHWRRIGPAFVCLCDPATVLTCETLPVGETHRLKVGGKTDTLHGPPLEGEFRLERMFDGVFTEPLPRHGGFLRFDMGRTALLSADSGLTIMATFKRVPPFSLCQLTAFGLNPASFRVLVAKGVHAPVAAYAPVCRQLIRVNTPGVTTADLRQLTFRHRRRPMFPFEPDANWH